MRRASRQMRLGCRCLHLLLLGALLEGTLVRCSLALPTPLPGRQASAAAGVTAQGDSSSSSSDTSEAGHQSLEDGLTIDNVAAEAAARPAVHLPSQYAVKGVIDPQSPLFSEEPGVLVPLAQGRSPVGNWLAAVEAAGPGTPLSDPMFVGTVFIPHNEAFEGSYPELRLLKLQGRTAGDAFSNSTVANLALQLNCLTVPGAAVKLDELWPGRLLRTAGFGALKVISNRAVDKPARLQHQPSGVTFSILEPDLQSGSAVAHVIDVLPAAEVLSKVALSPSGLQETWQYRSVLMALLDPVRHLQAFAQLVQQAALTGLMDSTGDAFTLFAPNEKAMSALMSSLPLVKREQLLTNVSLADAFVSSHLVLGTGLGSKALEALLPAGVLRTPQGNMAIGTVTEQPPSVQLPSGAVAIIETGRPLPEQTPTSPTAAGAAAAAAGSAAASGTKHALLTSQQAAGTVAAAAAATAAADDRAASPQLNAADVPQSAAAEAAAAGSPEAAIGRSRALTVAGAGVVSGDMVGGKAVLHVVDRVLLSPALSRELGLPPSPGYAVLDAPPAPVASSGLRLHLHPAAAALSAAAAFLLLLLP